MQVLLSEMVLEALLGKLLAIFEGEKTVFTEAVDAAFHDVLANLLGDFDVV